jgi:glutamate racemase
VIATEATVSSHAYRDALQRHGLTAYEKACPLFVPLVEEGWIEHPVTEQVARIYLGEALLQASERADVLVLACTHYPLIAPLLRRLAPEHMQIVDSAESTARVVRKMLTNGTDESHLLSSRARSEATSRRTPMDAKVSPAEHRTFRFYATDSTDKFKHLATRFLGRQVDHVEHVDLEQR